MPRDIDAGTPLEFGGVTFYVKYSWEVWQALQDAVTKAREDDKVSVADFDKVQTEACYIFCAAAIKSATGFQRDGKDVPYTPELLKEAFSPAEIVLLQNAIATPQADILCPNLARARSG